MHGNKSDIVCVRSAFLLDFLIGSQNPYPARASQGLIFLGITTVVALEAQITAVITAQLRKACIT
ncbi:MAG: hypothetical protein DMG76_37165 [Acidobacteria bacterium]|nr:MAG: hypothetical protein DMG76_37165 [Acidobacteriota bacterium]